jgi:hypothetical protein
MERRARPAEDVTAVAPVESVSVPFTDTALEGLERSLAARAFDRLPERWQMVLWHTEIEGETPAEVAPLLGVSPNGVSALAYRAREGLKQAYLQVHLSEVTDDRCRVVANHLGAWTREGLSKRETTLVDTHLKECERCRALAAELADVNSGMRVFIAPLVLGAGLLGYFAVTTKVVTAVSTVTAASAAGAAAGASGAANSLPKQFVGITASSVALVASIFIALAHGDPGQPPPSPARSVSVTPSSSGSPSVTTTTTR